MTLASAHNLDTVPLILKVHGYKNIFRFPISSLLTLLIVVSASQDAGGHTLSRQQPRFGLFFNLNIL